MRKSTSSELWTLLMRHVPPKWFARWMLAPAPTRARMMARWLQGGCYNGVKTKSPEYIYLVSSPGLTM